MVNRDEAPVIYDATKLNVNLLPCEQWKLDNHLPVYSLNGGTEEVVKLDCVFFAGNWYEQNNLEATATNYLLKNGTRHHSAFQINEYFEYYGAYLNRSCGHETASVTLHCLTKHLPHLLPMVAEILTESVFPEEELRLMCQNQKQLLAVNLKKCEFVSNRLIDQYIYGVNHPYGKVSMPDQYDALQQNWLLNYYDTYYVNGNAIFFISGKLPHNMEQLLNQYFGSLSFGNKPLPSLNHEALPASEKKYRIVNEEDGVQGAIRIGTSFYNKHHPHFLKAQVLNTILGGYFGSRLMTNIREEKGYTYGIYSYLQNHKHQNAWIISTEAGREVCEAAIEEVYKEMKVLREELIEEEELQLVRNYMLGVILGDIDGPFQTMDKWKNYILNDLDASFFYKTIETIKTISAAELKEMANLYLVPEKFYEVVVI